MSWEDIKRKKYDPFNGPLEKIRIIDCDQVLFGSNEIFEIDWKIWQPCQPGIELATHEIVTTGSSINA